MLTFEKILGKFISQIRKRKGISIRECEKRLRLRKGLQRRIELGRPRISPHDIRTVLTGLNIKPAQVKAIYLRSSREYLTRVYRKSRKRGK